MEKRSKNKTKKNHVTEKTINENTERKANEQIKWKERKSYGNDLREKKCRKKHKIYRWSQFTKEQHVASMVHKGPSKLKKAPRQELSFNSMKL